MGVKASRSLALPGHWPTWLVLVATWSAWTTATLFHDLIPWWILAIVGGMVVCQYGSLQHEVIHGHLMKTVWLQRICTGLPLGFVVPLEVYRRSHVQHHRCERLTDPLLDPESFYHRQENWRQYPAWLRGLLVVNQTLLGRLLIGPWIVSAQFIHSQWRTYKAGDVSLAMIWLAHLSGIAVVSVWLIGTGAMPIWKYLVCFVWPGMSLTLLRSYNEHKPAESGASPTQTVEAAWPFRILFLNNNYHALHHARTDLPWYALHRVYWETKPDEINTSEISQNRFAGYTDIARRFLLKPKDSAVV
ncbi:MAG: fatty acid desaturase [Gammaproteobacteria bacterium]|nr:fatty acid desaturase [Gammaproteobacteria bacterium]